MTPALFIVTVTTKSREKWRYVAMADTAKDAEKIVLDAEHGPTTQCPGSPFTVTSVKVEEAGGNYVSLRN